MSTALSPALVERLSNLLAAAIVKDVRARLAEGERRATNDGLPVDDAGTTSVAALKDASS